MKLTKIRWMILVGALILILIAGSVILVLSGRTLVFYSSADPLFDTAISPAIGDTVSFFRDYQIEPPDKVELYIVIDPLELSLLHPSIPKCRVLKCDDPKIIDEMIREWRCVYNHADYSTHLNDLLIYRNDTLVYWCAIEMKENGHEGFQTGNYGWIQPLKRGAVISAVSRFKPVYWPIVVL